MIYSPEEVKTSCLEYFENDELAASVCYNKYLMKDKDGNYLEKSPIDIFQRISSEFHRIEQKYPNPLSYEEIYQQLDGFKKIIPQGSPMSGIGNDNQITSLANCFLLPSPYDSIGGIAKADEQMAQISKRRGGVGLDISSLRPSKMSINNAAVKSDGVTCFMHKFSNTIKEISQFGRRGALLMGLDCRHPDIVDFIMIKRDMTKVTGANISVKWHKDFLDAVKTKSEYTLRFPVDSSIEDAQYTKVVKANEVWDLFVESNWLSAEPGCFFWDTAIEQSLSDCYSDNGFLTILSNPCGELLLNPNGSCILMAINMTGFVKNAFEDSAEFDIHEFRKTVQISTRLIDNLVDLELEKIDKIIKKILKDKEPDNIKETELSLWMAIKETYIKGRRTGLGITGFGDMLAMLNIKYGSDRAVEVAENIFKEFHTENMRTSCFLAQERGKFEVFDWDKEKDNHYIQILPKELQENISKHGRRNISTTTIAPAGSISILAQCSSGLEPVFKRSYTRKRKLSTEEANNGTRVDSIDSDGISYIHYEVFHHGLQKWKNKFPEKSIEESPYWESEAGELDWTFRVKLQGLINKYITHSISSTINLKKETTKEEISEIYMYAESCGCKGLTIFRDGSREGVMFEKKEKVTEIKETDAVKRPKSLECEIHRAYINGSKWIVIVGLLNGKPYELFGGIDDGSINKKITSGKIHKLGSGKTRKYNLELSDGVVFEGMGSLFSSNNGAYTRILSAMLRHGIPIKYICEQLQKVNEDADIFSFEKSIARVLKKYIANGENASVKCPQCNGDMKYEGGCPICSSCGYTKCG